jgi:hypothetical protein
MNWAVGWPMGFAVLLVGGVNQERTTTPRYGGIMTWATAAGQVRVVMPRAPPNPPTSTNDGSLGITATAA